MRLCALGILVLGLSVAIVAGCSPAPTQPVPGKMAVAPEKSAPPAPAAAPAPKPKTPAAPKAEPKPAPKLGADLLKNGALELSDKGKLTGWEVAEPIGKDWKDVALKKAEGKNAGQAAVQLPKPTEKYALLKQVLPKESVPLGKTLYFGATAKASTPDQVHVVLSFLKDGKRSSSRAVHPGNGKWVAVQNYLVVPPDADPGSVILHVFRHRLEPGDVLVDDVWVKPAL